MKLFVFLIIVPTFALAQTREPAPGEGVQVYGVLDAGVLAERGCKDKCAPVKVSPGIAEGSRIGISGREALGGSGNSAIFTLEGGVENWRRASCCSW